MTNWRDLKRQKGRDVHEHMRVPAIYIARTGAAPRLIHVRDHTQQATVEPNVPVAVTIMDTEPRIVFDRTEVAKPLKDGIVAFGPTEVCRLGPSRPSDPASDFITVIASRMRAADAATVWQDEWADLLP